MSAVSEVPAPRMCDGGSVTFGMLKFDFTLQPGFNFLSAFGAHFGLSLAGNHLLFPPEMGEGWMKTVEFSPAFRFTIQRYKLRETLHLRRKAPAVRTGLVSLIFYAIAGSEAYLSSETQTYRRSYPTGVEVASGDLNADIKIPAHTEVFLSVVAITTDELRRLLHDDNAGNLLRTVTDASASFLYHEEMNPEIERALHHLGEVNDQDLLGNFYFRIKVEELIYLLFHRLAKRETQTQRDVANADMEKLYGIRAAILEDFSRPPQLPELARSFQLSETKMKALFKQVFGESIYSYFQRARMQEAAFLLRQSGQSVSDVGYALGFSNLSHFSRLFSRYYQLTPKRFASVG